MANYFNAPTTGYKQYRGNMKSGAMCEMGIYSFTTTGTTVEVPTYFSTIIAAFVTPQEILGVDSAAASGYNETLYCDKVITVGTTTPPNGVTVSRVSNNVNKEFHFPIDEGQISSYNIDACPLMIAQSAMTLTQVEFFKGTAFGSGTTLFLLGSETDDGKYLEDETVTNTANSTDTYTSFTSGTSAVAVGDILVAETQDGGTSGPGDCVVSIQATATGSYTSGLTFNYLFIGLC